MLRLWQVLAVDAITRFTPEAALVDLDCDDTLFHKASRQVAEARDLARRGPSARNRVVHAPGLNVAVITLRLLVMWSAAGASALQRSTPRLCLAKEPPASGDIPVSVSSGLDRITLGARFGFHTARQLLYHVPVTRAVGPLATSRQMPQRL